MFSVSSSISSVFVSQSPSPVCFSFSFPNTPSILLLVNSSVCFMYGLMLYFSPSIMLSSRYFMMLPWLIVNIIFPEHCVHFPFRGGRLYFSLQLTHLNSCVENFLRFPLVSLMKCFSITRRATSGASTALIFSAMSICASTLSDMLGNSLYAEHSTPAFMFSVLCVYLKFSYWFSVPMTSDTFFIWTSKGILIFCAASYSSKGYLFVMSMLNIMSSTSVGRITDVSTSGASMVLPLELGKYSFEKFRKASISSRMHASSPSQSLLIAACTYGCARKPCVFEKPIILVMIPADVWGASPIVSCPISSSFDFKL